MKRLAIRLICLLAALLLPLSFVACAKVSREPVGSCAGQEILYDELRFQALLYLEKNENCSEEELRAGVEDALLEHYAIHALCAEYLPELSSENDAIKKAVDEEIQRAINSQGGKSAYKKMLKERYMTEDLMRRMLSVAQMQIELEKKQAINDVKNEVSSIAIDIAEAVIERDINKADHDALIDEFIDKLGESV